MLRYRVKSLPPKYLYDGWKPREAYVLLRVNHPEQFGAYEVEGDPEFAEDIWHALKHGYGVAGASIYPRTTAKNLHCAMFSVIMRPYQAELLEGAEILEIED